MRQNRPDLAYVPLMRKGECGVASMAAAVSDLWRKGASMQWQAPLVVSGAKHNESEYL